MLLTPGSPQSHEHQSLAYKALFNLRVPDVLTAGGNLICTATHSIAGRYEEALQIAKRFDTNFKFILLDPCSLEEADRRSSTDTGTQSDMKDILKDPARAAGYRATVDRYLTTYQNFKHPHLRIPQGEPLAMAHKAASYVLGR